MSISADPITVLVVDDEAPARAKIVSYLQDDKRFQCIGEAVDGPQALELIASKKPELLILDIQMPAMSGFDVLRLLGENYPAVIFATAYDKYAVQAFEICAADYLLKPISEQRMRSALDKVVRREVDNTNSKIESVLEQLKSPDYVKRLPVRRLKRVKLLDVADITRIVSENKIVSIYTRDGESYWTGESLEQLQRRLEPEAFFRIHRSSIINISAEFEIEAWEDGRLKLFFSDGLALTVARGPAKKLRQLLKF